MASIFRSPFAKSHPSSSAEDSKPSASAAAFGSSSGEFVFGGGARPALNRHGSGVSYLNSIEGLCLGLVGLSGNKFCCRTNCKVQAHKKNKIAKLLFGLYAQAGAGELYCAPVLEDFKISDEALEQLLDKTFLGTKEAIRFIELVNSSDMTYITDIDEIKDLDEGVRKSVDTKTPHKKTRSNVTYQYEQFMNTVQEADRNAKAVSPSRMADEMTKMLRALINAVQDDGMAIGTLEGKLQDVYLQIGNPPKGLKAPPNLWTAFQSILDEIANLREKADGIPASEAWVTPAAMASAEVRMDNQLEALSDSMTAAFSTVEGILNALKGTGYDPMATKSMAQISDMIDKLAAKAVEFQKALSTLSAAGSGPAKKTSVSFGGYTWNNHEELHAWMQTHLPAGLPFGPFVDVYSFLERVLSFRDVASSAELKNMETRKKLGLSADEALVLESFKHPLPKLLSGGASETAMAKSLDWLPGITTYNHWEDEYGTSGVKIIIENNQEVIRHRLEVVNTEKFGSGFPKASALANLSVSETNTFITHLCTFITNTHRRLKLAGFGVENSWKLVSKLVHRIFAADCHLKRAPVLETLNATDKRVLAVAALWGTFSTHQIMREYMQYGIENHPSISSEYVRFLVANCGLSKIAVLETKVLKLETDMKDMKALVTAASKSATSAANKADEAKKLASTAKSVAEEAKKLAKK